MHPDALCQHVKLYLLPRSLGSEILGARYHLCHTRSIMWTESFRKSGNRRILEGVITAETSTT